MLEVSSLTARAGSFRIEGVSLTVAPGECHTILGPSGAGKSTLIHAIIGIHPLDGGEIRLGGEQITHHPVEKRNIGYVPQKLALFPHLTVRENITYGLRVRGIPVSRVDSHLQQLVEITRITPLLDRRPDTLSGGERQRVALVRALVATPRLLLLDEPFTALNETLRRELWWLLKSLQKEQQLSILMVTHDMTEAHFLSERLSVMIDGKIEQSGERGEVYRRPATRAVAQILGMNNLFPARVVGHGVVDAPQLGEGIPVHGASPSPHEVCLAIRAEHVALRFPEEPLRPGETRLFGTFGMVRNLGDSALLHFRTPRGALLEIRCSSRTLRKYALASGDTGSVSLPAKDLFIIP